MSYESISHWDFKTLSMICDKFLSLLLCTVILNSEVVRTYTQLLTDSMVHLRQGFLGTYQNSEFLLQNPLAFFSFGEIPNLLHG